MARVGIVHANEPSDVRVGGGEGKGPSGWACTVRRALGTERCPKLLLL